MILPESVTLVVLAHDNIIHDERGHAGNLRFETVCSIKPDCKNLVYKTSVFCFPHISAGVIEVRQCRIYAPCGRPRFARQSILTGIVLAVPCAEVDTGGVNQNI